MLPLTRLILEIMTQLWLLYLLLSVESVAVFRFFNFVGSFHEVDG
jgi:hypothetical protein